MIELEVFFTSAIKHLEKLTGAKLSKKETDKVFEESLHIILHELAHSFLKQSLPWLGTLDENKHILVDEVLARFLERKVAEEIHSLTETPEEQLQELKMYSPLRNLDWSVSFYRQLYENFEDHVSQGKSIDSFARKLMGKKVVANRKSHKRN